MRPIVLPSSTDGPSDGETFKDLGVPDRWIRAMRKLGIRSPTPIQAAAWPSLLGGRHAILQAETGTGKTITYLLPCLEALARRIEEYDAASAGAEGAYADGDDDMGDFDFDDEPAASSSSSGSNSRTRRSPMSPAAVVLVPTVELVQQVADVAARLMPDASHVIRAVHGSKGVSRQDSAGMIVATPKSFRENVNFHHLAGLEVVVLDEADMLLTGHYLKDVQGYVLATFKQRPPELRPQHIFVAATLPSKGGESVGAFLDKYYPPPDVVRISTGGVHRQLDAVRQVFLQIDAGLPPTRSQVEAAQRLKQKMNAAAQRVFDEVDAESSSGASEAAVDVESEESSRSVGSDEDDVSGRFAGDSESSAGPLPDVLADRMSDRASEDHAAALKGEDALRAQKLDMLRRHALLEALVLPVRDKLLGNNATVSTSAMGAAADDKQQSLPPLEAQDDDKDSIAAGLLRKKHRRGVSSLGLSDRSVSSLSPGGKLSKGDKRAANAASAIANSISSAGSCSSFDIPVYPFDTLIPLGLPPALRTKLTSEEAAAVPPTIVFVNSVDAAEATRKFLANALPPEGGVRVAGLHKRVDEADRAKALRDFAVGDVRVLVATNVASRGLDTTGVTHVIQAEFAQDVVSHLHRIGRTARAGRAGRVTNLVTRQGLPLARAVLQAQAEGASVEEAFSRKRSFRRKVKKAAVARAEEEAIGAWLQEEEQGVGQREGGGKVSVGAGHYN